MHKFSYLLGLGYFKKKRLRRDARLFFLCFITHFSAKNTKKCKKMQKNEKKLQKNLHISKICCNFASSFKK